MIDSNLLPRLTRDISDGLIVLDMHGMVSFVNPAAKKLLEIEDEHLDVKYAAVMFEDHNDKNDDFLEFLIDAVYEKDKTHSGTIKYVTRLGNTKWLHMTTSVVFSEDGTEKEGVLVQFSDVTELQELTRKTYDSAALFVIMMAAVCVWAFVYQIWMDLGQPVSSTVVTKLVEVFGIILFHIILRNTSITMKDVGLSFRGAGKYILTDSVFTVFALAILIGIKAVLLRTSPDLFRVNRIFDLSQWTWASTLYPITVVVQEFLTRGVVHESIKRIMPGKRSDFWAILVSSLFFGAFHLHKGIIFMVGAVALLSVFGIIYRRQKTIWGLCIPHYFLGLAIDLLF